VYCVCLQQPPPQQPITQQTQVSIMSNSHLTLKNAGLAIFYTFKKQKNKKIEFVKITPPK